MKSDLPVPPGDTGVGGYFQGGRYWPPTRAGWALLLALGADAVQLGLAPLFLEGALSPVNDVLDVAVALAMTRLLGWHVAFVPALVNEALPFLDLFPTWTTAVLYVVSRRKKLRPNSASNVPPETQA